MGKYCALCHPLQCENSKVHSSKKPEDIAYCNVVRSSKYAEDSKADLKAGREPQDLDYGTLDMEEGPAKEAAKTDGRALAMRCAEAREAHLEKKRKAAALETPDLQTIDAKPQTIDAELRAILVEHHVEYQAWRLEEVGIIHKSDLHKIWSGDENLFGESGYSHGSLEILKKALHEFGPSGPSADTSDVVHAGANLDVVEAGEESESEEDSDSESVIKDRKGTHYRIWQQQHSD
jgi:hypothetical protein